MKYRTEHFLDKLIHHEGMVLTVYQDSLGIDTIGIGRNLKDRGITKEELDYIDIPNMDVVYEHGITEADARYLAMNDIRIVENELCRVHSCVEDLDSVRQLILMDMAFNMGVPRLCKFKNMWVRDNCPTANDKDYSHRIINIIEVSKAVSYTNLTQPTNREV